jgi:hypothetical protein
MAARIQANVKRFSAGQEKGETGSISDCTFHKGLVFFNTLKTSNRKREDLGGYEEDEPKIHKLFYIRDDNENLIYKYKWIDSLAESYEGQDIGTYGGEAKQGAQNKLK